MSHPTPTETTPFLPLPQKGEYHPPTPTDLRSPCPIVNTLANHGYIPRSGRAIRARDLQSAMSVLGISLPIRHVLTRAAYLERQDAPTPPPPSPAGILSVILHPFAYFFRPFGVRAKGQVDTAGHACLNLDELNRHGAIEHDVSISRRDFAQGDNHSKQADLVADMLACAHNGVDMTVADFARLRAQRIEQQRRDNPGLELGDVQNAMGLGEVALIQMAFGDRSTGWSVPVEYMAAVFGEERLPVEEGWRMRWWWPVGFVELTAQARKLGRLVERVKMKGSY